MANLILTNNCQRKCEYCFAQEDRYRNEEFTWRNFIEAAEFIATGPKVVNVLGGEPTLHKKFADMLEYLILEDYTIQVFTNGMVSDDKMDDILRLLNNTTLKNNQLFFAVNVSETNCSTDSEIKLQKRFFSSVKHIAYPSFTIHNKDTDLFFLHQIIEKYNLDPTIRLGLAMPVIRGSNKHLPISAYKTVAKNIIKLSESSSGTTIKFDCGFPLCMFTLEEVNKLNNNEENAFVFTCGQPLDIYPDLTVTNCYPLSKVHRINLKDYTSIMDVYTYFDKGFETPTGIYGKRCLDCTFFRKVCSGGCKGFYRSRGQEVNRTF